MANELRIREGGSFQIPDDVQRHNGTSWQPVDSVWVRRSGSWQKHWPSSIFLNTGVSTTNFGFVSRTGANSWSSDGTVLVPSSARNAGVASLIGGYGQFQVVINSDDGDSTLSRVRSVTGIRGKYVTHTNSAGNVGGPITWSGYSTVESSGANQGGVATATIPANNVLVGIIFSVRYVGTDDDTPTSSILGVRIKVGYTPVITSGGSPLTISYTGGTLTNTQTDSEPTTRVGDPVTQTTDITLPTNTLPSKVYLGTEILNVGGDDLNIQYTYAVARVTFGFDYRAVSVIE